MEQSLVLKTIQLAQDFAESQASNLPKVKEVKNLTKLVDLEKVDLSKEARKFFGLIYKKLRQSGYWK